jgi:hypothetical protein
MAFGASRTLKPDSCAVPVSVPPSAFVQTMARRHFFGSDSWPVDCRENTFPGAVVMGPQGGLPLPAFRPLASRRDPPTSPRRIPSPKPKRGGDCFAPGPVLCDSRFHPSGMAGSVGKFCPRQIRQRGRIRPPGGGRLMTRFLPAFSFESVNPDRAVFLGYPPPLPSLMRCPACGYWAFNGIECFDCGYRP